MTNLARSKRGTRTFLRPETLECRILLSASTSDVTTGAPAYTTTATAGTLADGVFDLGITGTAVRYSPIGTPAYMAGTVSFDAWHGTANVGLYQETLTPIFMDVNADLVPDFVGTHGVATFSFYTPRTGALLGTITTVNTSYIQGVTAEGGLLVGSTGTITAATGMFWSVRGGFTSASEVAMYPSFAMHTDVHFDISGSRPAAILAARVALAIASAPWQYQWSPLQVGTLQVNVRANATADQAGTHEQSATATTQPSSFQLDNSSLATQARASVVNWFASKLDRWASDLADCHFGAAC
jgi:hypothetical protein